MVITGTWRGRPLTISLKSNCITISTDDPTRADVYSFEFEGRLWTAFVDGVAYRRGMNGKIIARWREAERQRRWLGAEEALELQEQARRVVVELAAALQSGEAELRSPFPPEGVALLERIIAFDRDATLADARRYHEVYQPVGILPPDQYFAVVLQATEGCSFNTCTFCTFYKDRPFRIKPPGEFRAHAWAVREFIGQGMSLRRTVFLGDANSMVVPMPKLLPLIDVVHEVYDVDQLGGIYAFQDGFSGEKKSSRDYAVLHERGVKTLYVGLESGNKGLLKFLKKPGTPREAVQAVRAMKAGGIAVGVIVLLGAGGHQYAAAHVRDTIKTLNAMQLDMDDIIYFSEIVVSDEMAYARDAYRAGLSPLTHQERVEQGHQIEDALRFSVQHGTPKISRYDIREFIY